jgi:hypothetical protein
LKSNALENVLIFNCGSASKIAQYVALNQNSGTRAIKVVLLDNDRGGEEALRALQKSTNSSTVVKVSEEADTEIEDLFPITKGLQKKQKKQAVDALLETCNKDRFTKFEPLLVELEKQFEMMQPK